MPSSEPVLLHQSPWLRGSVLGAPPRPRLHLSFLDLPRQVRDQVYRHALHDGNPVDLDWELDVRPYHPTESLSLLCSSRQIHDEASAILLESVHVGSHATTAWRFLHFLGPARISQIRTISIYYHCLERCELAAVYGYGQEELDWMPVFELLRSSAAAQMDAVEVSFAPCVGHCHGKDHYLQTRCHLWWDKNSDRFWQGLETLSMVKQIRFLDPVPEYYARRTAKRLGWDMHGELSGGYSDPSKPLNRFKGAILDAGRLTPGDSPSSQQTRGHQPFRFLGLPLEVRHRIYDYACEWTYKPFWPECPARWNSGFGLLLVSRQISTEALPSIYRTFRIHGGRPLDAVDNLGPKLAYIRRLELHLSCFCPSGGRNLWRNNGTLFAARAADAQTTPWRPLGPNRRVLEDAKREWAAAMGRLQSLRGLSELGVTFQTCTRSTSYQPLWDLDAAAAVLPPDGMVDPDRRHCVALDEHSLNLLAGFRHVARVSLLGNVPPSLAVRLAQPYPGCGMAVKAVSQPMAKYIKATEEAWAEWNLRRKTWAASSWQQTEPFPSDVEHPTLCPVPHFVLAREGSARGKWAEHVAEGEGEPMPAGMQRVDGCVSSLTLKEMRESMDCDGTIDTPKGEGW